MPGNLDAAGTLAAGSSGREEDRRRARRLLFAYATLAIGGVYSVGAVLGGTLFLSRLPASAIPLLFLLPALGILVVFTVYDRLSRRVEAHRLAVATLWALVGATGLLRLAIAQTDGGSAAVLALLFLLVFVAGNWELGGNEVGGTALRVASVKVSFAKLILIDLILGA